MGNEGFIVWTAAVGGLAAVALMLGLALLRLAVRALRARWRERIERNVRARVEDEFRAAIEAEFGPQYAGGLVERLRRSGM
jgi:hypothetical protein